MEQLRLEVVRSLFHSCVNMEVKCIISHTFPNGLLKHLWNKLGPKISILQGDSEGCTICVSWKSYSITFNTVPGPPRAREREKSSCFRDDNDTVSFTLVSGD